MAVKMAFSGASSLSTTTKSTSFHQCWSHHSSYTPQGGHPRTITLTKLLRGPIGLNSSFNIHQRPTVQEEGCKGMFISRPVSINWAYSSGSKGLVISSKAPQI